DMNQTWACTLFQRFKYMHQLFDIMTVIRAEIVKADGFKQVICGISRGTVQAWVIQPLRMRLYVSFTFLGNINEFTALPDRRQMLGKTASTARNRHVIVVQHHHQIGIVRNGIVQGFKGHTRRHGAIANNRYHFTWLVLVATCQGHAQTSRNCRRRMPYPKGIKFRFFTCWKGCQTIFGPDSGELFTTAGQCLMRIGLMPHIPDQTVMWSIEAIVQSHRKFNNTEVGTKMSTTLPGSIQNELT